MPPKFPEIELIIKMAKIQFPEHPEIVELTARVEERYRASQAVAEKREHEHKPAEPPSDSVPAD